MKKILVLVSLLITAAACSNAPSGNKDVTANANSVNANKGTEMKTAALVSESDIIAKEKASWDAIKTKDWDGFGKMLASDYIEILDDGVHDKASALTEIKNFDLSDVTFADWKMLPIDKDAVIITYTATAKAKFKGEAVPPGPYREVSAYVNRNGEWLSVFYQETLARAPQPAPSPAANQPAKQAASPAARPGEPGPDVTANEKLVWEALKSKNADAFASYLTNDFMHVETDGVYDKAGSVEAVRTFDFSRSAVSDWKSVKFDDDASLVIYTVKTPGMKPDTEYHSTIWVNRGGKWLALFHQGTPAAMAAAKPDMKKM
ncbi:MAG TPA: nuclear transport factor 2 family protein [Pyrinomonadaceae bacterium]|nr:nuclear transport factor 2 family protein [Pyrinomonadaceae bacterium]